MDILNRKYYNITGTLRADNRKESMITKRRSAVFVGILLLFVFTSTVLAGEAAPAPDELPDDYSEGIYLPDDDDEEDPAVSISLQEYPCYLCEMDDSFPLNLYFVNEATDLPYIDLKDLADLLVCFQHTVMGDEGYELDLETDGYLAQLTRENRYSMLLNFQEGTISFEDYDMFIHSSQDSSLIDVVAEEAPEESGNSYLIERINKGSFDRYGKEAVLNLEDYDIHLYLSQEQELYLVPLHTMGVFLISLPNQFDVLFNEKAVYVSTPEDLGLTGGTLTSLGESWKSGEKKEMSGELAWFNYCELCLLLDNLYGLKEIHDITSFDRMFIETGYRSFLTSTDSNVADGALRDFIYYYLDDLHSGFIYPSYRTEGLLSAGGKGLSSLLDSKVGSLYRDVRNAADHQILPYEEVGNTAYITFDSFERNEIHMKDYYSKIPAVPTDLADDSIDTIDLIIYAHSQICREDSPVENVVLDLSLNGGGAMDAGMFAAAWLLGEASLSIRNSMTGAVSTGTYRADTNLDGVFDEADTVSDKNLYCLIGPYCFSCGNLVANLVKTSHMGTLLGQTSGGGSCIVLFLSTANGAMFRISSPYQMSHLNNGSYYDIDTGIDPDCVIVKTENFYDREALTEYINQLF